MKRSNRQKLLDAVRDTTRECLSRGDTTLVDIGAQVERDYPDLFEEFAWDLARAELRNMAANALRTPRNAGASDGQDDIPGLEGLRISNAIPRLKIPDRPNAPEVDADEDDGSSAAHQWGSTRGSTLRQLAEYIKSLEKQALADQKSIEQWKKYYRRLRKYATSDEQTIAEIEALMPRAKKAKA